jgi:hypothetical protein
MNNYTERTWVLVTIGEAIKELMKTYLQHPLRKQRSESYSRPIIRALPIYQKGACPRGRQHFAADGKLISEHAAASFRQKVAGEFKEKMALALYLYICLGAVVLLKSAILRAWGSTSRYGVLRR